MMDFLPSRREFSFRTPVHYRRITSKTQSGPGRIHSDISASDDHNLISRHHRSHIIRPVSLHKVVSCQELICRKDTVQVLAGNPHKFGKPCTRTDEHRTESFLVQQRIDCHRPSDHDIGLDFHSEGYDIAYLLFYNLVLRKPELRNTIFKNSTRTVQSLEYSNIIPEFCQICSTSETGRTASDYSNLISVGRSGNRSDTSVLPVPVSDKTLQFSDSHRFAFHSQYTAALALCFLRTHPSTDSRQR